VGVLQAVDGGEETSLSEDGQINDMVTDPGGNTRRLFPEQVEKRKWVLVTIGISVQTWIDTDRRMFRCSKGLTVPAVEMMPKGML
jgi:hypothetical protein